MAACVYRPNAELPCGQVTAGRVTDRADVVFTHTVRWLFDTFAYRLGGIVHLHHTFLFNSISVKN